MNISKNSRQALKNFIERNNDARELKRALAVKMNLEGLTLKEIAKYLNSSFQFVSKWKQKYLSSGVEGLRLGYQGASHYLSEKARIKIEHWLKKQESCTVEELEKYIRKHYKIHFKSRQSYYALLKERHLSFKKSQKINPRSEAKQISNNRYRLKKTVELARVRNTGKKAAFLLSG